jgi:hypothetical protein
LETPNGLGERPPGQATVSRTWRSRSAARRRTERQRGGSSPPICYAIWRVVLLHQFLSSSSALCE